MPRDWSWTIRESGSGRSISRVAWSAKQGIEPRESKPTWLRVVVRDRGGKALGVLQHRVNLWPSQKARLQRLILDALRQFLDDPCRLPKRGARLPLLTRCLIHASQRRLDLPLFCWQTDLCCQLGGLAQMADGSLLLPLPRGEDRQRPEGGNTEASIGPQTLLQPCHFFSRLAFIPRTQ